MNTIAPTAPARSAFDAYATEYEDTLTDGLRIAGEGPEYFAQRRIDWTRQVLAAEAIDQVLDFGCGIGLACEPLLQTFRPEALWAFDLSRAAIERAGRVSHGNQIQFRSDPEELPTGTFDLVYCNGVFHHILPAERGSALASVYRVLRPGGWFALWENNPWNPGTRMIMRRIPFDRDAATLSPPSARRLLRSAGFRTVRSDAWFLFPHALRWLRPLESLVHRLPLGGQYLVLAQKPHDPEATD